jgi:hypothetical protein
MKFPRFMFSVSCLGALVASNVLAADAALTSGHWEKKPAYICGTGDVIAGVDLYYNWTVSALKIVVRSQSGDNEDNAEYIAPVQGDMVETIEANQQVTLVGKSKESFEFGGGISNAILFNLRLNPSESYDRSSVLAEKGTVISLFCNRAKK